MLKNQKDETAPDTCCAESIVGIELAYFDVRFVLTCGERLPKLVGADILGAL